MTRRIPFLGSIEPWTHIPRGYSLVGMLVALLLGLLVVAGAGAVHVAALRAHRLQDARSRLLETGQLAIDVLGRHARLAGYADLTASPPSLAGFRSRFAVAPLLGCANGYFVSTDAVDPAACLGDPGGNDSLLLRYQALPDPADASATLPGYDAASGVGADCLGQGPDAGGSLVAASHFRVSAGSLSCLGNGNPGRSQPLFEGIEQLRIRYVIDSDGNGAGDLRVRANHLSLATPAGWDRVRAIEVCLLARAEASGSASTPSRLQDCDDALRLFPDGRQRQVFRSVLPLPNLIPGLAMVREGALP